MLFLDAFLFVFLPKIRSEARKKRPHAIPRILLELGRRDGPSTLAFLVLSEDFKKVNGSMVGLRSHITGMTRENDDYESLLSLVHLFEKVATAAHLTVMSMEDPSEQIWILDGRETTWQLSHEERKNAMDRLYQSSFRTSQEQSEITTQLIQIETPVHEVGDSQGGNFFGFPNQQKDPTE